MRREGPGNGSYGRAMRIEQRARCVARPLICIKRTGQRTSAFSTAVGDRGLSPRRRLFGVRRTFERRQVEVSFRPVADIPGAALGSTATRSAQSAHYLSRMSPAGHPIAIASNRLRQPSGSAMRLPIRRRAFNFVEHAACTVDRTFKRLHLRVAAEQGKSCFEVFEFGNKLSHVLNQLPTRYQRHSRHCWHPTTATRRARCAAPHHESRQ